MRRAAAAAAARKRRRRRTAARASCRAAAAVRRRPAARRKAARRPAARRKAARRPTAARSRRKKKSRSRGPAGSSSKLLQHQRSSRRSPSLRRQRPLRRVRRCRRACLLTSPTPRRCPPATTRLLSWRRGAARLTWGAGAAHPCRARCGAQRAQPQGPAAAVRHPGAAFCQPGGRQGAAAGAPRCAGAASRGTHAAGGRAGQDATLVARSALRSCAWQACRPFGESSSLPLCPPVRRCRFTPPRWRVLGCSARRICWPSACVTRWHGPTLGLRRGRCCCSSYSQMCSLHRVRPCCACCASHCCRQRLSHLPLDVLPADSPACLTLLPPQTSATRCSRRQACWRAAACPTALWPSRSTRPSASTCPALALHLHSQAGPLCARAAGVCRGTAAERAA